MTTLTSQVLAYEKTAADLAVKVFADGADRESMLASYANPLVSGFTTNPTLMRQAGVTDYRTFAHDIVAAIPDRHISFEVFSDEFDDMERQAREIATWGENVYAKIPVSNTKGEVSYDLVHRLSQDGVKVNVTAIFLLDQVREVAAAVEGRGTVLRVGFCRSHRRRGARLHAGHGRVGRTARAQPPSRTHLGQPPRGVQCRPSRRHRLPHHHLHQRHHQKAADLGQGVGAVLARDGADLLRGCHGCRL